MPDPLHIPLDLPDGLSIRLTCGRAGQHQALARLPLSPATALDDVARLVDVEVFDPDVGEYRFSGLSLAELLERLRERVPAAHAQLTRILRNRRAALRRLAEQVARTALAEQLLLLPQPPYASALGAYLHATGPAAAPASQWLGLLAGAARRGIRQHEIDASGLHARLAARPSGERLTRRHVLDLIGLVHVVPRLVSEIHVGFLATAGWRACRDPLPPRRWRRLALLGRPPHAAHEVRFRHRSMGWAVVRSRYRDLFTEDRDTWCLLDHRGHRAERSPIAFATPRAAMGWAAAETARRFAEFARRYPRRRWRHFSLTGAAGYEELLLQLDACTDEFWSNHYPVRNVLVHARVSRHGTGEGRHVLFVDELQSDWATAATRDSETPAPPFRSEWVLLAFKTLLWWAQRTGCAGLAFSTPALQSQRWDGPPSIVYGRALTEAAASIAKLLQLPLGRTPVTENRWHTVRTVFGWRILSRPATEFPRTFDSRAAAERVARRLGGYRSYEVPVLWIDTLPPLAGIPLYGLGTPELWLGGRAAPARLASAPSAAEPGATTAAATGVSTR